MGKNLKRLMLALVGLPLLCVLAIPPVGYLIGFIRVAAHVEGTHSFEDYPSGSSEGTEPDPEFVRNLKPPPGVELVRARRVTSNYRRVPWFMGEERHWEAVTVFCQIRLRDAGVVQEADRVMRRINKQPKLAELLRSQPKTAYPYPEWWPKVGGRLPDHSFKPGRYNLFISPEASEFAYCHSY